MPCRRYWPACLYGRHFILDGVYGVYAYALHRHLLCWELPSASYFVKARLHWVDAVQANVFVSVHMVDLNNGYVVGYRSPATGIGLFKLVGRALAQLGAIITLATSTATVRTVRININAATIVITVSINHTVVLTDTDTYGTGNGLL